MIALPIFAIALVIYQCVRTYRDTLARTEAAALRTSAARASDLIQWASIDPE